MIFHSHMSCRICLESTGQMISPCGCKGSAAFVHPECIQQWISTREINRCEICHEEFYRHEYCSFEPRKYLHGCVRCGREKQTSGSITFTLWILCFNGIVINFIILNDYILMDAITTLTITMCAIGWGLANKRVIHDVLVYWKMAASFPFLAACLVGFLTTEDTCNERCSKLHSSCNEKCPFYHDLTRDQNKLNNAVIFDTINICILLLIRSVCMCFVYMRKTKLLNRPDEHERLLGEPTDDV